MQIIFISTNRIWLDPRVISENKVSETAVKISGTKRHKFLGRVGISYLKGIMHALHIYRCDAVLSLTIAGGQASLGGKVACKTAGIEDDVKYAVHYLARAAKVFAKNHPHVEATLYLRQILRSERPH